MTKRKMRRERGRAAKAPVQAPTRQKYRLVMSAGYVGRRDRFAEYIYVANGWIERLVYGFTCTVAA